mgnify:CR=1 FL=1
MNNCLFPVGSGGASIVAYFIYGSQTINNFPLLESWSICLYNVFVKLAQNPTTMCQEAKRIIYSIFNLQIPINPVSLNDEQDFTDFCNRFIDYPFRFEFVPIFPEIRIALRNIITHSRNQERFMSYFDLIFLNLLQ